MRMKDAMIALLCFALIGLLLIADRYFTVEPEPIPEPERDWGGWKAQQMVAVPEPSAEPEMYVSEDALGRGEGMYTGQSGYGRVVCA